VSRFCLKTLPLNTPLFGETVFEKSRVFNLSRFKISIWIWWCFVRGRTFWDGRDIRSRERVFWFFWNQLWLSFGWSARKLKVFPGKVNLKERSVSYSKMNTLLFSVFLLFVLTEMYSLSEMKSTFVWERTNNLWVIQDKHYDLSVLFFFGCVLLILTMICFCFLMVRMTGAGWCCRSGTLSTLFGNAP